MMRAIATHRYCRLDELQVEQVKKPEPKADEVLVKIVAASANPADFHVIQAMPFPVRFAFGLFRPSFKVPGSDCAGIVEAVGSKVTRLKVGDEVYSDLSASGFGAFGEYVCNKESVFCLKPANITFEEAAALPMAATTALEAFKYSGEIKEGESVLVLGVSGGIGSLVAQIVKSKGGHVTGVCSTSGVDMVKGLGIENIIDYTKEDYLLSSARYDVIFDTAGKASLSQINTILKPKGRYVFIGGDNLGQVLMLGRIYSFLKGKTFKGFLSISSYEHLVETKRLVEAGVLRPLIGKVYPLEEAPQAVIEIEKGHAKGKQVIKMLPASKMMSTVL